MSLVNSIQTLDSNLFQDFSSSMLIELFGIKVFPGGRGKDGGRDAVYNGKLRIPRTEDYIEGKWLVQVKFYDKDQTSQSTWLKKPVNGLKSEIKKFKDKKHDFNNYLMITNVPLTWVEEKGTFDEIDYEIKEKYNKVGFKHLEVFDANRIKCFLPLIPLTANYFLNIERMSHVNKKTLCTSLIEKESLISIICNKVNNSIFKINNFHNPHFRSIFSWEYEGLKFYQFNAFEYNKINIIMDSFEVTFRKEIIVVYGLKNFLNVLKGKINFLPIPTDATDKEKRVIEYQKYLNNPLK